MKIDFIILLLSSIIAQLLIFSILLFKQKKNSTLSHKLLGLFFLSLALNLITAFCSRSKEYLFQNYPFMFYVGSPFAFLYTPMFYFYIKSLTDKNFIIRKTDVLHIVPFISFSIYLVVAFFIKSTDEKRYFLTHHSTMLWAVLTPVLHFQIILYAIFIIKAIRKYRAEIKEYYSSIVKINYSWLIFIFWGMLLLWLVDVIRYLAGVFSPNVTEILGIILFSSFLFLCYLIIYKALTYPEVFRPTIEMTQQKKIIIKIFK